MIGRQSYSLLVWLEVLLTCIVCNQKSRNYTYFSSCTEFLFLLHPCSKSPLRAVCISEGRWQAEGPRRPRLYRVSQVLQVGTGHCSWGASLLCAPLGQLRSKVVYFLQNSISVSFNWALVGREMQDFGSNKAATHEREVGVGEHPGGGRTWTPHTSGRFLVIWVLIFEYRFHSYST